MPIEKQKSHNRKRDENSKGSRSVASQLIGSAGSRRQNRNRLCGAYRTEIITLFRIDDQNQTNVPFPCKYLILHVPRIPTFGVASLHYMCIEITILKFQSIVNSVIYRVVLSQDIWQKWHKGIAFHAFRTKYSLHSSV